MKDLIKTIKYKRSFETYLDYLFEDVKIKDDYNNPYKKYWWKDTLQIGTRNTHDTYYGFFISVSLIIKIKMLYGTSQYDIIEHIDKILKNKFDIKTVVRISDT